MKLGDKISFVFFLSILFSYLVSNAEEKIISSPLINLEKIKPSFEEQEIINENLSPEKNFIGKKKDKKIKPSQAILIGLDKITAKSSEISITLNETKKFGPLEIKILKCSKIKNNNKIDDVAYMQVKDISKSEDDKVFIFNGWTFASDPNITPFDHAIYDIQLLNCSA